MWRIALRKLLHGTCAGSVNVPVPPVPAATGAGGTREVVALLVPFLRPTPQHIANNLLHFYIKYHLELGFSKFVQYTQARSRSCCTFFLEFSKPISLHYFGILHVWLQV